MFLSLVSNSWFQVSLPKCWDNRHGPSRLVLLQFLNEIIHGKNDVLRQSSSLWSHSQ